MEDRAIGIFDSGVGGLTVLKQIKKILPNENIIFYADTANAPYGDRSRETILNFSRRIIKFLISKNVKLIVIACNTVSSNCFDELQKEFSVPIMEIVNAAVEAGINATKNKKLGVIGTTLTISSGRYEKLISEKDNSISVFSRACPKFAQMVEDGQIDNQFVYDVTKNYLDKFKSTGIDTLVLLCTHYPVLKNVIQNVLPDVNVLDPANFVASDVKSFLEQKKMLRRESNSKVIFFVSGNLNKFRSMSYKILDDKLTDCYFVEEKLS